MRCFNFKILFLVFSLGLLSNLGSFLLAIDLDNSDFSEEFFIIDENEATNLNENPIYNVKGYLDQEKYSLANDKLELIINKLKNDKSSIIRSHSDSNELVTSLDECVLFAKQELQNINFSQKKAPEIVNSFRNVMNLLKELYISISNTSTDIPIIIQAQEKIKDIDNITRDLHRVIKGKSIVVKRPNVKIQEEVGFVLPKKSDMEKQVKQIMEKIFSDNSLFDEYRFDFSGATNVIESILENFRQQKYRDFILANYDQNKPLTLFDEYMSLGFQINKTFMKMLGSDRNYHNVYDKIVRDYPLFLSKLQELMKWLNEIYLNLEKQLKDRRVKKQAENRAIIAKKNEERFKNDLEQKKIKIKKQERKKIKAQEEKKRLESEFGRKKQEQIKTEELEQERLRKELEILERLTNDKKQELERLKNDKKQELEHLTNDKKQELERLTNNKKKELERLKNDKKIGARKLVKNKRARSNRDRIDS